MDDFANRPAADRKTYFEQSVVQLGILTPQLIEKDFWVCWTLRRLFELPEIGEHLTFKGGTSLSKAYSIIERFSEDVDLSIEREWLGFGGDDDPAAAGSGKARMRRLDRLQKACQKAIADQLLPQLQDALNSHLRSGEAWELTLDEEDADRQTILFQFPKALGSSGFHSYFAPSIRLELGARSDHFPVEQRPIQPYLSDAFPDLLPTPRMTVRVLGVDRTFWEKATILHANFHLPAERSLAKRQSRHYYDLFRLAESDYLQRAIDQIELLRQVAEHKSIFFRSAAARYDEARPGTLRLVPPEGRIAELRSDYKDMEIMFFHALPGFDEIIGRLRTLETRINALG